MALTVSSTITVESLKKLFNRVTDVFFSQTAVASVSELGEVWHIPVGSDGVNFDAGDPDITKYKLTNGEVWTAIADAGDSDVSFQVPSVHDTIASLFQNKITSAEESITLEGVTYKGHGYDTTPKKVAGAMLLRSQDKETVILLPNIEGYATPKLDDTGKPLYYNFQVTPEPNSKGVAIYYMFKDTTASTSSTK